MQRSIGLAQAMINDPSLLILDEPTSGLDPLGCREVKDLILMLKKRGKTVLVTSHLLSDVEDICDRVVILYGGKVRAAGSLDELLVKPDASTITTPLLKGEVMERVIKILRNELSGEEFHITSPRMSLEEYFLDVINKAKTESVDTAGAVSTGKIADYLSDGVDSGGADTLLRELTGESLELQETLKEESPPAAEEAVSGLKTEMLKDLARDKDTEARVAATEAAVREREKAEDLSEANAKLRDLL